MAAAASHLLRVAIWASLSWGVVQGMTTTMDPSDQNYTYLERFIMMKNSRNYDYQLAPINIEGDAVVADLGIYINNIGEISEVNMEYSLNIYFRQLWVDYRLEFVDEIPEVDSIAIPDGYYTDIWVPDTFVENGKSETIHTVTKENKGFRVYKDGSIFYSQRLSLSVWCEIFLKDFPMDTQVCHLRLMSYRYKTSEMVLKWLDDGAIENNEVELPMFTLEKVAKGNCTSGFSTGAYSCVYVTFTFRRQFGYYFAQIYVPSILIIVLSWVSFWLDPMAVPGRISLGVLTILTMTNQMSTAASSSLPKVSYVKAIDVWLTTCLCFLFAALMEFAIVNSLARKPQGSETQAEADSRPETENSGEEFSSIVPDNLTVPVTTSPEPREEMTSVQAQPNGGVLMNISADKTDMLNMHSDSGGENDMNSKIPIDQENKDGHWVATTKSRWRLTAAGMDKGARIFFPTAFLIFNMGYWLSQIDFFLSEGYD